MRVLLLADGGTIAMGAAEGLVLHKALVFQDLDDGEHGVIGRFRFGKRRHDFIGETLPYVPDLVNSFILMELLSILSFFLAIFSSVFNGLTLQIYRLF